MKYIVFLALIAFAFAEEATDEYKKAVEKLDKEGCNDMYTTSKLNTRSGPSTNYDKLGSISKNAKVCVVSIKNDWALLDDKTYVSAKYLTSTKPEKVEKTSTKSSKNAKVDVTELLARSNGEYIKSSRAFKKGFEATCKGFTTFSSDKRKLKQQNFIQKVLLGAQKGEWESHILASLTIAQAILESGWGKAPICNNIFGIKATASETKKCLANTREEYTVGVITKKQSYFKAYDSIDDSVSDHATFLMKPRYAKVIGEKNYKTACTEIKKAGYATSSTYTQKLINLMIRTS